MYEPGEVEDREIETRTVKLPNYHMANSRSKTIIPDKYGVYLLAYFLYDTEQAVTSKISERKGRTIKRSNHS